MVAILPFGRLARSSDIEGEFVGPPTLVQHERMVALALLAEANTADEDDDGIVFDSAPRGVPGPTERVEVRRDAGGSAGDAIAPPDVRALIDALDARLHGRLDQIEASLGRLDTLDRLGQLERLSRLDDLDRLGQLDRLERLAQLDRLDRLAVLDRLDAKLDRLATRVIVRLGALIAVAFVALAIIVRL